MTFFAAGATVAGVAVNAGINSSNSKGSKAAIADAAKLQTATAQEAANAQLRGNQSVFNTNQAAIPQQYQIQTKAINDSLANKQQALQDSIAAQRQGNNETTDTQRQMWQMSTDNAKQALQQTLQTQIEALQNTANVKKQAYQDALAVQQKGWDTATDSQKQALQQATQIAQEGYANSSNQLNAAYSDVQGLLSPYSNAGKQALSGQQDLLGLNGNDKQTQAINTLENGSQFTGLVKQGENALLQNASATGGVRGGNTAAALAQFRPQMLQDLIDKQFVNLGSLSNQGLGASTNLASARTDLGQNLSANTLGSAQAGYNNVMGQSKADQDRALAMMGYTTQAIQGMSQADVDNIMSKMGVTTDQIAALSQNDINNIMNQGGLIAQQKLINAGFTAQQIQGMSDAQLQQIQGMSDAQIQQIAANTQNSNAFATGNANTMSDVWQTAGGIQSGARLGTQAVQNQTNSNLGYLASQAIGPVAKAAGSYFNPTQPSTTNDNYGFAGLKSSSQPNSSANYQPGFSQSNTSSFYNLG